MNKLMLFQSLRLSALSDEINKFAETNTIQSVSILKDEGRYIASVVYNLELAKKDEKPSYTLNASDLIAYDEFDGITIVTKDKKYSGGGPGFTSIYAAVESIMANISNDFEVSLVGYVEDVKVLNVPR